MRHNKYPRSLHLFCCLACKVLIVSARGGSKIFSSVGGGGGGFQKILTTFLGRPNFWALFGKFFGARSPSKLVYIGANGTLRKILGSVGQK